MFGKIVKNIFTVNFFRKNSLINVIYRISIFPSLIQKLLRVEASMEHYTVVVLNITVK